MFSSFNRNSNTVKIDKSNKKVSVIFFSLFFLSLTLSRTQIMFVTVMKRIPRKMSYKFLGFLHLLRKLFLRHFVLVPPLRKNIQQHNKGTGILKKNILCSEQGVFFVLFSTFLLLFLFFSLCAVFRCISFSITHIHTPNILDSAILLNVCYAHAQFPFIKCCHCSPLLSLI